MVTTFGRPGYLRRAVEAGASGFVVKDTPARQLAEAVRRVHAGPAGGRPGAGARSRWSTGASPLTARETEVLRAARDGGTVADVAARPAPVGGHGAQPPVGRDRQDRRPQPRRGRPHRRAAGLAAGDVGPPSRGRLLWGHDQHARADDDGPAAAEARRARGRPRRRARADGRHHEPGLPHAVPRVRRRALRLRDDHHPRAGRAQREDAAHGAGHLRRAGRLLRAALRRGPGDRRAGRGDAGRRERRRHPPGAHRPQFRLPGAQGDPQGRGIGAAVAARAVRATSCGRRCARPATCRSR